MEPYKPRARRIDALLQDTKMTPYQALQLASRIAVTNSVTRDHENEERVSSSGRGRKRVASEDEKLQAKRAKNRKASARAREKTKSIISELTNENSALHKENANLRAKLAASLVENRRLMLTLDQNQQSISERSHPLSAALQQLQEQVQARHRPYVVPPPSTRMTSLLLQPTNSAKLPFPSRFAPEDRVEPQRNNHIDKELATSAHDVLRTQNEIQRLREEVKGVRDFLARHSI
jgi:hypothetical protein